MKNALLLSFRFLAFVFFVSCSKQHQHQESQTQDSLWNGMDEFHFIMAESFHPFKDSSNLEPAKKYAHEMDSIAGVWLSSPRPEKVNTDVIKEKLQKLKTGTELFAVAVLEESDSTLAKSLTNLHDQFHTLQEAWYAEPEGH